MARQESGFFHFCYTHRMKQGITVICAFAPMLALLVWYFVFRSASSHIAFLQ